MSKPALKKHYQETVFEKIKASLGCENPHQVPAIQKVVINSGFSAQFEKPQREQVRDDIAAIAGQRPVFTKARKSISNFKLREGMPIGVKVTLRGDAMWEFLYRVLAVVLPGVRDFRGLPSKLDGRGNYTFGITDHSVFPEVRVENMRGNIGMDITVVTSTDNDEHGKELLKELGFPFRSKSN